MKTNKVARRISYVWLLITRMRSMVDGLPIVISKTMAASIMERDGERCQYCGTTEPGKKWVIDHIISKSLGGVARPYNLVVACWGCNAKKHLYTWLPANLDAITQSTPDWCTLVKAIAGLNRFWHRYLIRVARSLSCKFYTGPLRSDDFSISDLHNMWRWARLHWCEQNKYRMALRQLSRERKAEREAYENTRRKVV